MARVVQRRGNPPYLLILFVFLTLFSAALAGIFYNRSADEAKRADEAAIERNILGKPSELTNTEMEPLWSQAKQNPAGPSVVGLQRKDIASLVQAISGTSGSVEATLASVEGVRKNLPGSDAGLGLVSMVGKLNEKLATGEARIKDLEGQLATLTAQTTEMQKSLDAANAKYKDDLASANKDLQAKQAEVATLSSAYAANVEAANKDAATKVAEKDKTITERLVEIANFKKELDLRDNRIAELLKKVADGKPKPPGEQMTLKPDAKVLRALPQEGVIYISIGSRDRVSVGLPFTVYSLRTGVTATGEGKARVVVTNITDNTAECRVLDAKRTDPIVEGDLVANVAFDSTRKFTFVVEGDFDIDGTGKTDPMGAQRVRQMIAEYGGKVSDKVTVDTDFVVLGMDPTPPAKPADNAPESAKQLFADAIRQIAQYEAVKAAAISLQVPTLNTNRFLALVGARLSAPVPVVTAQ